MILLPVGSNESSSGLPGGQSEAQWESGDGGQGGEGEEGGKQAC